MRATILVCILLIGLMAVGCAPTIQCEAPSKVIGSKCCIDSNDNNVCDAQEMTSPKTQQPPQEEVETKPAPEQETVTVESPEPEQATETAKAEVSSYQDYLDSLSAPERSKVNGVRNMVKEAMNREENYFYRYTSPTVNQQEFWVKGKKVKTQIREPTELDKFTVYNIVYLDLDKGTAEGYCETGGKGKCWKGHGPFPETVSKNMKKTPKDWLLELGDEFEYKEQNQLDSVVYYEVHYKTPEGTYRVFLENWKGWPFRIELYKNNDVLSRKFDTAWNYQHMNIGAVVDDDLAPDRTLATSADE